MLYIYIGSIVISYIIAKSSIINVEKSLKQVNLHTKETDDDKSIRNIIIFILSCIPVVNIITAFKSIIHKDTLYNTLKQIECEMVIQDNEELLNKYEKICNSGNEKKRRTLEKQISIANTLINSGFDKDETLNKIVINSDEKAKVKTIGTMPRMKKTSK